MHGIHIQQVLQREDVRCITCDNRLLEAEQIFVASIGMHKSYQCRGLETAG